MLLLTLATGCLFDAHNPKWEELYDPRCTERGAVVYLDGVSQDSIQDAIDDADDGDTVEICPGEYTESLWLDKELSLVGRTKSGDVVIDADRGGPVVSLEVGGRLEGLVLERGQGYDSDSGEVGGGVLLFDGDLEMVDCVVRDNRADLGGGLYLQAGEATLERVRLEDNEADETGGGAVLIGEIELIDVVFAGNTAEAGGAFASAEADITWRGGALEDNEAEVGTALALFSDVDVDAEGIELALSEGAEPVYLQSQDDNAELDLPGSDFQCTTRGELSCD